MIELGHIFLQVFNIQEIFLKWEQFGLYNFILPFLLLFSILFGVLGFIKTFSEHKSINVIISVALSLIAVRFQFFTDFVQLIAPRLGVGIIILLAIMILIGLFTPDKSRVTIGWIMLAVGVIIAIVIFGQLYDLFNFGGGYFTNDLVSWLLLLGLLIGVIVAVVVSQQQGAHEHSSMLKGMHHN